MIANRSFSNARRHLEGAGVIFQRLGPEGLTSELARDLFCEYRVADVRKSLLSASALPDVDAIDSRPATGW